MRNLIAIAIASSVLLSNNATAEPQRERYVKAIGGFGMLGDTRISGPAGEDGDLSFDSGFAAGLAAGINFGQLRLEGEYLYQTNDTGRQRGSGFAAGSQPGDFSSVAISANAIGTFKPLPTKRATVYLGAGLVWLQEVDLDFETSAGEVSFSNDAIGYQLLTGIEYQMSPRWTVGTELRYLNARSQRLEGEGSVSGDIKADYDRSSLLFSIGYRF